jgi:hypothetical protein
VDDLNAAFERHGVPAGIHHFGSIFFLKFPAEYHFALLFYYLIRERSIHILEGFPGFLTTAHDDADLAKIVEATIARWIGHYQTLLEVIAGDMDQAALQLRILTHAGGERSPRSLRGAGLSDRGTRHSQIDRFAGCG